MSPKASQQDIWIPHLSLIPGRRCQLSRENRFQILSWPRQPPLWEEALEEPYWTMGEEKSAAGDSSGGTLSLTSFAFRGAPSQPVSLSPAPPSSSGATFNPPPPTCKATYPTCSLLSELQSGQWLSMENRDSCLHRRLLLLLLLLLPPPHTHQGQPLRHTVPNQVQNGMGFPCVFK